MTLSEIDLKRSEKESFCGNFSDDRKTVNNEDNRIIIRNLLRGQISFVFFIGSNTCTYRDTHISWLNSLKSLSVTSVSIHS